MTQADEIKAILTFKGIGFKENQNGSQLVTDFIIGSQPVVIYPSTLKTVVGIKSTAHSSVNDLIKVFTKVKSMSKLAESKFKEMLTPGEVILAADDARALLVACHAVEIVMDTIGMQRTKRDVLELAVKMVRA